MKSELTTLGQICTKIGSGATPRGGKEAYKDFGISLIRSQNVLDFKFSSDGLAFIDEIQAEKLNNVEVLENDILLNITGDSVARACKVDKQFLPARVNQHVAIIRPDKSKADADYILYFMQMKKQFLLQISASGGTRNALTKKMIEDLEIELPTLEMQKKVASVLSALDEKIALNQQINNNLEQQVQAIYQNWYENNLGKDLPSTWKTVKLGDFATIQKKTFNPSKEKEVLLEHYSIPAFDEAKFPVFESSTKIKSNKYVIDQDCFMISKLNPTTKRVWKPYCISKNAVCSTEFIVYKAKHIEMTDFLFSAIDSASFSDFMCSHVTGSTGSRQRTTPSDTLNFEFVLPSYDEVSKFTEIVRPIYEQIKNNYIENDRLRNIRDNLLPRLMTGEFSV